MSFRWFFTASVGTLVLVPFLSSAQTRGTNNTDTAVQRGKYIVEDVANCWMCHAPIGNTRDQLFGGPVPFAPVRSTSNWAEVAPRLAGEPPGTDEQFITLMMTGIARTGKPPRPPMPQFRMTRPDAEAVLAFLKSITPDE